MKSVFLVLVGLIGLNVAAFSQTLALPSYHIYRSNGSMSLPDRGLGSTSSVGRGYVFRQPGLFARSASQMGTSVHVTIIDHREWDAQIRSAHANQQQVEERVDEVKQRAEFIARHKRINRKQLKKP